MIANLLSILRILLLPPLLYTLPRAGESMTPLPLLLLVLGALTDFADGYLARRLDQVTRLGMILDPLADKIVLGGLAIALVLWRDFPVWLMGALLARDIGILLAGLFLLRTRRRVIPANRTGKYTTVCMASAVLTHLLPVGDALRSLSIYLTGTLLLLSSLIYARQLYAALPLQSPGDDTP